MELKSWYVVARGALLMLTSLVILNSIVPAEGSKIFFMIPLTTVSEKNVYVPLINGLAERGHQVTVATIKKSNYKAKNIYEFAPIDHREFLQEAGDPLENRQMGKLMMYQYGPEFNIEACHKVYQNEEFMKVIQNEKFDLIFANYFFGSCFMGIIHKLQTPFIMVSTMPPVPYAFELTGLKLPTSFVPNPMMSTSDRMTFFERVENTIFDFYWSQIYGKIYYLPASEEVYRKYLGQDIPDAFDIETNVSLVFSNSHFAFNSPAPALPDVVEVGGMHCQPAKPLPKDLEDFVSGGKDGFIFFSLGSVVQGSMMPDRLKKLFNNVFSKLKQRVLWKFESDDTADFAPNVKTGKWLPQQDILGHPKLKLFISHGGLLSTQESVYQGVPVLGLPIFIDQNMNTRTAEARGFAKTMEILDLTEESLLETINELITNPKYAKKAKELSTVFRDQLETPLERAIYWTEYVIRHKGANHMRSAARDLPFYQYYLFDVFAFLFLCFFLILAIILTILKVLLSLLFSQKDGKKSAKKTQ